MRGTDHTAAGARLIVLVVANEADDGDSVAGVALHARVQPADADHAAALFALAEDADRVGGVGQAKHAAPVRAGTEHTGAADALGPSPDSAAAVAGAALTEDTGAVGGVAGAGDAVLAGADAGDSGCGAGRTGDPYAALGVPQHPSRLTALPGHPWPGVAEGD